MKFKKVMNLLLILLFFAALLVPLVTSDFQGDKVSAAENRYLATFPDIIQDGRLHLSKTEFENWINDNIGGRSLAQKLSGQINYMSAQEHAGNVVEGKDQWLYLLPDYEIPAYCNTNLPNSNYLDALTQKLLDINDVYAAHGIRFVSAIYPAKYDVYPEYAPDSLYKVNSQNAFSLIAEAISANDSLHFIAPYDELVAGKETRLTYSKAKDASHWNNYGAFLGYQALMSEVKTVLPDVRILTEDDFEIEEEMFSTVKDNGFETTEADLVYTLKENHAHSDKNYLLSLGFSGTDPWQSYNYFYNDDPELPKAVVVGDSFTWMFMLDNLAQSFSELVFIHYNDLSQLDYVIQMIQPDIVIAPFLNGSILSLMDYEPLAYADFTSDALSQIPAYDESVTGFQWLDYCNDTIVNNAMIPVSQSSDRICLMGWAIDSLSSIPGSAVIVEVGDQFYAANYGQARESVSVYFGNPNLLNSGYTICLNAGEVLNAGKVTIHVISADGAYRYPPQTYNVEVLP